MNKNRIFIILFLFVSTLAIGQTDKEKAVELGRTAIELMDNGKLEKSIELLENAQKLDPERIDYPYEKAYAYYKKENYKKAIKILNTITDHKDVSDFVYQLLGNSYDYIGKPEKALETYKTGMKKFPNSGKFHLESGQIKFAQENYNEAIALWEEGIKVNPNYSSNYYRLAKIFSHTEERIWSLLYGEHFVLLEPNTKRTEEISKLLYETYKNSNEIETDSTLQFHLTKAGFIIDLNDKKAKKGILPFEGTFASAFVVSAIGFLDGVNIASIHTAREGFLDFWFDIKKFDKVYPNKLFDYQKEIKRNGFFKAYSYWLLSQGNPTEYQQWYAENKQKFSDFANWFNQNRIEIKERDFYSRKDYK